MNPQPVSLADELRKLEQKWRQLGGMQDWIKFDWLKDSDVLTWKECADELSTLLDQHAVTEPQRVLTEHQRKVEEAAGMPIDWGMANASTVAHAAEQPKLTDIELYALVRRIRTISFDGQAVDLLRAALLTSPVAPPPPTSFGTSTITEYSSPVEPVLPMCGCDEGRCYGPLTGYHCRIGLPSSPVGDVELFDDASLISLNTADMSLEDRAREIAEFGRDTRRQTFEQCAKKLEKVAAQCEAGGHTSRGKMFRAMATEFRAAPPVAPGEQPGGKDWFCSQPGCDKLHSEHSAQELASDTGTCCENGNFGEPHICMKQRGDLPPNISELHGLLLSLDRLLTDPHPGLMTWREQYEKASEAILAFYEVNLPTAQERVSDEREPQDSIERLLRDIYAAENLAERKEIVATAAKLAREGALEDVCANVTLEPVYPGAERLGVRICGFALKGKNCRTGSKTKQRAERFKAAIRALATQPSPQTKEKA